MKRRIIRYAVMALCFVLVVTGNIGISRAAADATVGLLYVSDVMCFQGPSMEECVASCEEMGYTPCRQNLNKGAMEKRSFRSDVDGPCVILGYTTTNNRNLAITDVSLLHMGEGYEIKDFRTVAAALLAKNHSYAEGLAATAADFAQNYDKGSPAALDAYKALDLMYVDDLEKHSITGYLENVKRQRGDAGLSEAERKALQDDLARSSDPKYYDQDWSEHVPLSQFVVDGKADVEFFGQLLSFGTPAIINAINIALCRGAAEYKNALDPQTGSYETRTWAERLQQGDAKSLMEGGLTVDEWRRFDSAYQDSARSLAQSIQEFTTLYLNARARGATIDSIPASDGTDDPRAAIEAIPEMQEGDVDWVYVAAFEIMNKYHFSDNQLLGDWVVEMGQRRFSASEDFRALYPLADVISSAQLVCIKYCGLATFVNCMSQGSGASADVDEVMAKITKEMRGLVSEGEEFRLSVWTGVDANVYNGKVAMTSDAIRINGAASVLALTEEEKAAVHKRELMLWVSLGSGFVELLSGVIALAVTIKAGCMGASTAAVAGLGGFWGFLGTVNSVSGIVGLVILLIQIVVAIVTFIYKYIKSELSVPSDEYTEMPTIMYETSGVRDKLRVIKYNAVFEPGSARVADTNAYVGYQWNCLYVSHDADAGSPVVVPPGKEPFLMTENNSAVPTGYMPVALFGQRDAADLNYGAYKVRDAQHNYLFFATEETAKALTETVQEGDTQPIALGEEQAQSAEGQPTEEERANLFVSDIVVETGDSVERARANVLKRSGRYYLLDRNLGSKEHPIFMGYALTENPDLAVRDIRVMACADPGANSFTFGTASYSKSGDLLEGDALFFSTDKSVGTPIRPGFTYAKSAADVKEGMEAVVYASGAPVYLFGTGDDTFALYFEPQVKYTSGELYVAGIGFATGAKRKTSDVNGLRSDRYSNDAETVKKRLSWPNTAVAFDQGRYYGDGAKGSVPFVAEANSTLDNYALRVITSLTYYPSRMVYVNALEYMTARTYLVYMLTHNPYRALRDVGLYSGSATNDLQLSATLSKGIQLRKNGVERTVTGGYVACENIFSEFALQEMGAKASLGSHAYLPSRGLMRNAYLNYCMEPLDDGSPGEWKYSLPRMRGMYVLGPVEGMEPLKASDVVVTTTACDAQNVDGDISCELPATSYALDGSDVTGSAFHSVQDLRYPYHLKAQNISMPDYFRTNLGNDPKPATYEGTDSYVSEPDDVYIYLRGTVHRPRYISSVTVGSFSVDMLTDANKNTKEIMGRMSDEMACRGALAGSTAEMIPVNLVATPGNAWYETADDKGVSSNDCELRTSYIAVSRTDDPKQAARGLLLVSKAAAQPGSAAIANITVKSSTQYYIAQGSGSIPMPSDEYYLYYSLNPASLPGSPITDIVVDQNPYLPGMSTTTMSKEIGAQASFSPDGTVPKFIHCAYENTGGNYINALYVGMGDNLSAALLDILGQGCTEAVVANLNEGGGKAVAVGMRKASISNEDLALHKRLAGTRDDPMVEAIRDVIVTVGRPLEEKIVCDGVVYRPVKSRKSVSFGWGSDDVYLYEASDFFTIQYNKDADKSQQLAMPSSRAKYASPITKVGFAFGDRVPYNSLADGLSAEPLERWENVLTTEGSRADLNSGVILKSSEDSNLKDNRMYMFCHRDDNSVKEGAEITGGFVASEENVGTLVGVGE